MDFENVKKAIARLYAKVQALNPKQKKILLAVSGASLFFGSVYLVSRWQDSETHVYHKESVSNFKDGKILDGQRGIYQRKEQILSNKVKDVESVQKTIIEQLEKLRQSIEEMQKSNTLKDAKPENGDRPKVDSNQEGNKDSDNPPSDVSFSNSPAGLSVGRVNQSEINGDGDDALPRPMPNLGGARKRSFRVQVAASGPALISFPVQAKERTKEMTVTLPPGAFVKAKLLTGVEASEANPVPVLMQADYAFIGPNKTRIDLAGCFFLAKSQGNLSIERVEAQITTLSCVSKSGRMFERNVNGYLADAKDNSFAVMGSVNSKQDRVAAMAFLSSIVEGVGKAVQQAQTTSQSNAMGGTSTMISGDQAQYMAAGGVSNAAGLVTQWYLKHAQNLLPTINIGSGQDVWIVMQSSVELPNWYFSKPADPAKRPGGYSYLSGILN